jgi:hypothetical protein
MGIRAHVVKTFICEYGCQESFNRQLSEVHCLLDGGGVEVHEVAGDCIDEAKWEIHDIERFAKLIEKLEELPATCKNRYVKEYTNEHVVSVFKEWLECVDKKDNIIRVHWF